MQNNIIELRAYLPRKDLDLKPFRKTQDRKAHLDRAMMVTELIVTGMIGICMMVSTAAIVGIFF